MFVDPNQPDLDLDFASAYDFYRTYILDPLIKKEVEYENFGFNVQGSIGSQDWEIFAAKLLKDRAKGGGTGADLSRYDVKSASGNYDFEYQYHRDHGLDKLEEDKIVDHIFISYSNNYRNVIVRWLDKKHMLPKLQVWQPLYVLHYQNPNAQRFRKQVTHTFVVNNGVIVMEIAAGEIVFQYAKANPNQPGG